MNKTLSVTLSSFVAGCVVGWISHQEINGDKAVTPPAAQECPVINEAGAEKSIEAPVKVQSDPAQLRIEVHYENHQDDAMPLWMDYDYWVGRNVNARNRIEVEQYAQVIARAYHLPSDLVLSVIQAESNFDPNAESHAGAIGLMQLIPRFGARDAYGEIFKTQGTPTKEALLEPKANIVLGVNYLSQTIERYANKEGVSQATAVRLALAAYNWGMGRVDEKLLPFIQQGYSFSALAQHMPSETWDYVGRVMQYRLEWEQKYQDCKEIKKYGQDQFRRKNLDLSKEEVDQIRAYCEAVT